MEDSLPDPVAYARNLADEDLLDYRETYGERSREWIIAREELARRRRPRWLEPVLWGLFLISLALLAWMRGWL